MSPRSPFLCTYRPSLSSAVYKALHSFWKLPISIRSSLPSKLPKISLDSTGVVTFDWILWLRYVDTNLQNFETDNEVTWALALQAEVFFDNEILQLGRNTNWHALRKLTHFDFLEKLVMLLHNNSGEFYLGFCVGVTILEKALYDLHNEKVEKDTASRKKKNMILRDLLHSDTLIHALPNGLIRLLKIMFLPSGLNLRNLVWHGFITPAEFPKCFGCLTLLLIMMLPHFSVHSQEQSGNDMEQELFRLDSFDAKFETASELLLQGKVNPIPPNHLVTSLRQEPHEIRKQVIRRWVKASFIPPGRVNLVQRAINALVERGDELWFLFAVIPVLEHGLRLEFSRLNRKRAGLSNAYEVAQLDAYYSTLDGFGQKDKHQVLLHPAVLFDDEMTKSSSDDDTKTNSRNEVANALYEDLPFASLVILLDLFMMSNGPNLRAKLCHGEATLSSFMMNSSPEFSANSKISTSSHLLFQALVLICESKTKQSSLLPLPIGVKNYLESFRRDTTSSFHPFYRLYRALNGVHGVASNFAAFRDLWTHFTLEKVDCNGDKGKETSDLTRISFNNIKTSDDQAFTMVEKSTRVAALQVGISKCPPKATDEVVTKKHNKSLTFLIGKLTDQLHALSALINEDFQTKHRSESMNSRCSAFLALVGRKSAPPPLAILTRAMERNILALSDPDGLSVASCMMEIISCCQRSLQTFRSRIEHLQHLVREGKARTNHRRSLLTSISFVSVFEHMQLVSLSLVEHQLVHLSEVATRSNVCPRSTSIEQLQPKLLQCITSFEGCTRSSDASHKSGEQAVERALQFFNSKAMKRAFALTI